MAPAQQRKESYFKTTQKIPVEYAPVTITQYESTRTGMRVAIVDQKGPKVYGFFALATEIHDDSGAPHTLEHLCFMGSRTYRYKGLLDKLSTRAYSTTNAWTGTDQTVYQLETAGWAGFAQILPVYLEHLIVPTLTDAGCYTEVHHVDGEGNDAGVVYSEMQGRENGQYDLMDLAARRLFYPEGNGYRYETGGLMKALRVLSAQRIRDFHKEMYQPKNMCLVLTGDIDHDDLLRILDDFEDTIIDDVPKLDAPFKRPWVDSEPSAPLTETKIETVYFPEEDESMGEIMVFYEGPAHNDHMQCSAMTILLSYLCGTSISVMENTLVEREQLCSAVMYGADVRPRITISFQLAAVETKNLAKVEQRMVQLLKETAAKPFDMSYMHDVIAREKREILLRSENAGNFFADPLIEDHLFGNRDGSDLKELATIKELDALLEWTDKQWRDFFSKWLADAPRVTLLGTPSKELSDKIKSDEKARVQAQREKLGENGLAEKAKQLKQAQDENDRPIPEDVLSSFPVPGTDSIHFIDTTTARSGPAKKLGRADTPVQSIIDKDDDGSSPFIQFEHIPSEFVRIELDINTASVPTELKPLLVLYEMNFFTTPVNKNGKRVEFEDVVLQLERDTVKYGMALDGSFASMALQWQVEPSCYEKVIAWTKTHLFDAIHDPVRLHASLTKVLADIPDEKRDGHRMLSAAQVMTEYGQSSCTRARSTLTKAIYLKRIRKLLKANPDEVIAKFQTLCAALHRPENFRIKVAANVEKLPNPVSAWKAVMASLDTSKPLAPLVQPIDTLTEAGKSPGSAAYIVPIAAIDSSFATLSGRGPVGYEHPDLPALRVAQSYLDAVEGPLWVSVRGTGLAYGCSFSRRPTTGMLSLGIYRSPDAYKAYAAAKEQVEGYASGKYELDKFALEGAISGIVLEMADREPTAAAAASASYVNTVFLGLTKDYPHRMLQRVRSVTPEQVREAIAKYMVPVFDPKRANLFVTCSKLMSEQLVEAFGKVGFKPEVRAIESFQDDYGLPAVDGEDDPDEEDEDDEDDDEGEDTPGSEDDEE